MASSFRRSVTASLSTLGAIIGSVFFRVKCISENRTVISGPFCFTPPFEIMVSGPSKTILLKSEWSPVLICRIYAPFLGVVVWALFNRRIEDINMRRIMKRTQFM